MPQRRQAQQMHVPMSTQKHSKKRLFSSAQGKALIVSILAPAGALDREFLAKIGEGVIMPAKLEERLAAVLVEGRLFCRAVDQCAHVIDD